MEKPASRSNSPAIPYGCHNTLCPNFTRHQEAMWLNTYNTSMMMENWMRIQPVGNSDRFGKKAIGKYRVRFHSIIST